MAWLKVAQIAKELGISKAAVYKKVESFKEQLKPHLRQNNGITEFSEEGVQLLRESLRRKEGTLWDGNEPEANEQPTSQPTFNQPSTEGPKLNDTFNRLVDGLKGEIESKNQMIDRLFQQLEEQRKVQADERARTDTIIMKLAHDLEDTRKTSRAIEAKINNLLEEKKPVVWEELTKPPCKVKPWQPKPYKDPMEGLGFFERLWIQFLDPQKLRQAES